MAEPEAEQIGPVDAVIGLVPLVHDEHTVENTVARMVESAPPMKIALVHPPYVANGSSPLKPGPQWQLIADPQLAQNLGDSYRAVFSAAQRLGARASAVVASDL